MVGQQSAIEGPETKRLAKIRWLAKRVCIAHQSRLTLSGLLRGAEGDAMEVPRHGAMNDALLSQSVDIAVGGVPIMWDKAKGPFEVKGISALNNSPLFLNTRNTAVRSTRDLTPKDKIAITRAALS